MHTQHIPTVRNSHYDEQVNTVNRLLDLDLIEEKRLAAQMRMVNYKQRTKAYHDKRVIRRVFQVGDWVLRNIEATGRKAEQNKLSPNWEGPYIITQVIREGTYRLKTKEGKDLKHHYYISDLM